MTSGTVPWPVLAPALLLVAVTSPFHAASGGAYPEKAPLALARDALLSALRPQPPRPPASDLLLRCPDAVTDLCAAAELVLERLALEGDLHNFAMLLTALIATLGGAVASLAAVIAAAAAASGAAQEAAQSGSFDAAAAAAAREAAVVALAALHSSCRQLGAACGRAAAAQIAAQRFQAPPVTAPTAAALSAGAERIAMDAAAAAAVVARTCPVVLITTPDRGVFGAQGNAPGPGLAASLHNLRAGGSRAPAAPAAALWHPHPQGPHAGPDPRARLAFACVAACGLLEGCAAAVRLQPPHVQQPVFNALQPALEHLAGAARSVAAAAAAADAPVPLPAAGPAAAPPLALEAASATAEPQGPAATGPGATACLAERVADPAGLLGAAVGYSWARLRMQPPLQVQQAPPLGPALADVMAATAAGVSHGAGDGAGGWHPARGSLGALLGGALGVARLLELAGAGAPPGTAAELLEGHIQGPLFADTQLMARAILEAARQQPGPSLAAGTAVALLQDTAAAARRLHQLYGAVADAADGRVWLAALPPVAAGSLRDILDRVFVCAVSVLATACDAALPPPPPPLPLLPPPVPLGRAEVAPSPEAAAAASAAVAALGALGDLQFCALQLRAYGDLVSRLNSFVAAAPAAAVAPLISLLPCYPALAAAYAAGGSGGPPTVAVSRLAFLLPVTASCLPHAGQLNAAAAAILPFVYLLLKGAPEAVTQAAHAVWAALLDRLCAPPPAAAVAGPPPATAAGTAGVAATAPAPAVLSGGVELAASMVPYYVERTCQAPCGLADLERLERGLRQVLRSLPDSHPVKAWCVTRLAQQLACWMRSREAAPAPPAAAAPAVPAPEPPEPRAAAALGTLVAELDYPLLPYGLAALTELVSDLGAGGRTLVLQQLYEVWLQCNDYARKPLLDEWLRRRLAEPMGAGISGSGGVDSRGGDGGGWLRVHLV